MKTINKIIHLKFLYIFFIFLSLNIYFFSTVKTEGKAFDINNIDISQPFKMNFNKNEVINEGFKKAYAELISLIVNSSDLKKINKIKLNEIKGMIESFTIKEEKFINEIYYVNLGVSFNKKKIFNYLEEKNIFPSLPIKNTLLFIPIIIDENKNDLLIFYNNKIFDDWNKDLKTTHLIQYILPTEDLEDLNLIKNKYDFIEQYDFKEITNKYDLNDSIIVLIFKNEKDVRVLSRITLKDNTVLKNQTFSNIDINDEYQVRLIIDDLKLIFEDYWKELNQINTSIKLNLNIKVNNDNNLKISNFENTLKQNDMVYDYFISKFNKSFTYYRVIYNGTQNSFLKNMNSKNYNFDTQNKIWILE